MNLPPFFPCAAWIVTGEAGAPHGGVYPPIEKQPDGTLIVDRAEGAIRLFDNRDHPNGRLVPADAPRAVLRLYRRDWQLRYLRAVDAFPIIADIDAAMKAWARYCARRPA